MRKTFALERLSCCRSETCFEALARAFPHPGFEFEEHVQAMCLQDWTSALVEDARGIGKTNKIANINSGQLLDNRRGPIVAGQDRTAANQ